MSVQPSPIEDRTELSAADAREIARLLGLLLKKELPPSEQNILLNKGPDEQPQPPEDRAILVAKARVVFSERKRRADYFKPVIFGEPAWDMLLALYITDFAGGQQSIGKLVNWIGAPQTTALRWINYLEKEHMVSRGTHPRDRRTVIVDITAVGRRKLDQYFSELRVPLSG
jgi:DNA-binding MarR family transcriptional regulator